uniref:Uncharacterized protein n=1 Tax=Arundo donax TaxID=35708 RepID=A0A0A9AE05_ARUDO
MIYFLASLHIQSFSCIYFYSLVSMFGKSYSYQLMFSTPSVRKCMIS